MTMSSRKSTAVRILAVVLAIPILGAVVAYFWINRVADRRWAAAQERIRQIVAAFPDADERRLPETVTEASKDNQIHFVAAIRAAAPKRTAWVDAMQLVQERQSGEALDAVLDEAQDFLDRLHQGARRIAAVPANFPPRWHGDWDSATLRYMMTCGILRARRQREMNKLFDAAETLLDSLQLGRFWSVSGKEINRTDALEAIVPTLDELRELLSNQGPSPDELRRIELELQPLVDSMKSPLHDLEPGFARWAEYLERLDFTAAGYGTSFRWRFLPGRLMKAEAFELEEERVRRLLSCEGKPYLDLLVQCRLVDEEGWRLQNPLIGRATHRLRWTELRRKAELRLLRVAAHYGATGDILDLGDPYGKSILHSVHGTRVKFWSVGDDGHDHGADAGTNWTWWRPGPLPGKPYIPRPKVSIAPKDIVIEVPWRP